MKSLNLAMKKALKERKSEKIKNLISNNKLRIKHKIRNKKEQISKKQMNTSKTNSKPIIKINHVIVDKHKK